MKDLQLKNIEHLKTLVLDESQRQIEKWGIQDRHPMEWMCFITEEVGELAEAITSHVYSPKPPLTTHHIVEEAIQAATLLMKVAEMFRFEEESGGDS